MEKIPSYDEFRACVLESYRPLFENCGFKELPKRPGEFVNEFSVRIGNSTTVIEIEGIHYGLAAWTKIFRTADADTDSYGLPIHQLLTLRVARRKKPRQLEDQLADIRRDAADILQHAKDVLSGDFAALDDLVAKRQQLDAERRARAPSPEQRAALVACAEAGHAFERGDYRKVVDLLRPHINLLSPAQKKRYEIAFERIADA